MEGGLMKLDKLFDELIRVVRENGTIETDIEIEDIKIINGKLIVKGEKND